MTITEQLPLVKSPKPCVRWWWFSGPLEEAEIDEQLEWIREKGFGGVELAWVYPQPENAGYEGLEFLSEEWRCYVLYTIDKCSEFGLGCDVTFGTLWPFGGSFVPVEHSSKITTGYSEQRLEGSWESRYRKKPGLILNHLEKKSLQYYSEHLLNNGFGDFADRRPMAFFCDSWEVEGEQLFYDELYKDFFQHFGYRLEPFLSGLNEHADVRCDYRKCLSDRILEYFFSSFADICTKAGAVSRVQCHGAPADILAAYALVDIPETETLLFDPDFALIAASAAAVFGKKIVSSETFTCLYGWVPKTSVPPVLGDERADDLRCVSDAQFAWGVNRVIWHGKPYSAKKNPGKFYATVHVGDDGTLSDHFKSFNRELTEKSAFLQRGETYSKMAVYFPVEDEWMKDQLPPELQKPSSHFYWEFQETHMPEELLPWRPLWFSGRWLDQLVMENGVLRCGSQTFEVFYSYARWMPLEHLRKLAGLLKMGAPVVFGHLPQECGHRKHSEYADLINEIKKHPAQPLNSFTPLLSSEKPLDFWCRKEDSIYLLFISHPQMRNLRYPMETDYHRSIKPVTMKAGFTVPEGHYPLELDFGTGSILCTIDTAAAVKR